MLTLDSSPLLLKVKDASSTFFHVILHVCTAVCACVCVCACLLKWSYLYQHSSPMTGGMEGSRGGGGGGCPERDQRRPSGGPVSTEVQEQVEVWILNIEKLHRGLDIYIPWQLHCKALLEMG